MSQHSRKHRIFGQALAGLVLSMSLGALGCGAQALTPSALMTHESVRAAVAQCGVDAGVLQATWSEYRNQRPFHAQQVAASEPLEGGCRVLILSEPPAEATLAMLGEVHPALGELVAKRHPIGVDGWTEDLVGVLPPMSDEDLSELTSDLHFALFGSAYRARLTPIEATPRWNGTLNIEVRPAELYEWMFGQGASFSPVDGGPARTASDLLSPQQTGVYVSSTSGLVLWSLPKRGSFDEQKANVRMFGLESDLVLGALADEDTVLVIGRERVAPEDVLPPLRFETVKILATTSLHELHQSYERTQLLAGPMDSGADWAPIRLSAALVDTELGSVLNITDQMLKRWSLNGTIEYERFRYPNEPAQWAFQRPISEELGSHSLTFNWNTKASGSLVQVSEDRSLYWMNRTGALHVSYLPDELPDARTGTYEDTARDFFAGQSDPYLVRAVQYTALFQAFRQLGVTSVDETATAEEMVDATAESAVLETAGTEAFQRLMRASRGTLVAGGTALADRELAKAEEYLNYRLNAALAKVPSQQRADAARRYKERTGAARQALIDGAKAERAAEITGNLQMLRNRLQGVTDAAAPRHLAVAIVHRSLVAAAMKDPLGWPSFAKMLGAHAVRSKAEEIKSAAEFLAKNGFGLEDVKLWREAAAALSDANAVEKLSREASGSRPVVSRVRTPTVVWSSSMKLLAHGGHNVGSEVSRLSRPIEPSMLTHIGLERDGVSYHTEALPLRPRQAALGGIAPRAPLIEIVPAGQRSPAPEAPGGGWARLTREPTFSCGGECVTVKLFERGGSDMSATASALRSRYKVDVGGSVFRAGTSMDIAESAFRTLDRASLKSGAKSAKVDIVLLDAKVTPDEARGLARSIHTRFAKHRLGADDSYVLHRSDTPIALGDFDLARAHVSEPIRTGDDFTISVSVPRKQGRAHDLVMHVLGRGEPAADAAAKTRATIEAGLRSPEDIVRELNSRFGKKGDPFLLELALEAQGTTADKALPLPGFRYGGAPGHSF